jgi:hypothetical protein
MKGVLEKLTWPCYFSYFLLIPSEFYFKLKVVKDSTHMEKD